MKNGEKKQEPACSEKKERGGSFSKTRALVVGITGGYGSGKTTVARMFEELGAEVINADEIVHDLMNKGTEVRERIKTAFGEGVLEKNGNINRRMLGKMIFADEKKRKLLEEIIHPAVIQRLTEESAKFRREGRGVLMLEIPLLIEKSLFTLTDKIIVVNAEQETQINRLQKRYGIEREEALQRISSQIPLSEKIKLADWIVDGSCSIIKTKNSVRIIWTAIQNMLAPV